MAENDIVGVRIVGRYQDQNIVNTMHYRITAQESTEQEILGILAQRWLATHGPLWRARHIDTYRLVGVSAFSLTGLNKVPGIATDGTVGSVTGAELPSSVCRTITLYTNSDNYRRHGRVMLSGSEILQLEVGDGGLTATELALLDALGVTLIADLVDAGDTFTPGLAPVTGPPALPFEPFTGSLARRTPSSVTSRRIRRFSIG